MNKEKRVNWFKFKLLCIGKDMDDVANIIDITHDELILLVKGEIENKKFVDWVTGNIGKPYWL